ncbi:hypothetical protein ACFSJY_16225 [Thalassotalea euphylliae]|uniref:hypothetical protein n=1 Tax=Thalassotalea euphylliae TaxID=1655234 RepID=UPI003641FCEA
MIEHGNYTVEIVDDTMFVNFDGMFNYLASKNLCELAEKKITDLNGNGFYLLINLTNYEGSTPDAHEEGNRHAIWLEKQNCLGKAIVIQGEGMLDIIRSQQEFLSQSKILTQVFKSEDEAKSWLCSLKQYA